jgi:ubiquinone/menaquinone biosynthesis C-methylase UbiE
MKQEDPVVTLDEVQKFWQENPLCAMEIPFPIGSKPYFEYFDALREHIEPPAFAERLHEFSAFAGKKVLDVGCGNGWVLSRYAAKGAEVFGVDVTQAAVDLCGKRFENAGLKGDFRVADAQNLPFPDNTFDCVCSMGVLHHVPDTAKGVSEIHRVLKPGGRLIVMFYHKNSAKYQWSYRRASWRLKRPLQELVNEFDGAGNPKGVAYTRSGLRILLSRFQDLKMFVGYLEARDVIPRFGKYLPDAVFRPLAWLIGWNLYAKARKAK